MKHKEYTAGLSITERCNLRCRHCYIGQKSIWKEQDYSVKEISLEQIKEITPSLQEANVKRINLGGGETTLHKDFIQIITELHTAGMKVGLTTNGTTFSIYKNHLSLFNDIGVSIDFPDERHSEFRMNKKVFSRDVDTLYSLVNAGVKTELVTCIMSINYKELPKIYALAREIGVDMWRLNRFHSSRNDLDRFKGITNLESRVCQINDSLSCSPQQMKDVFEYLESITPKEKNYAIPDPIFRTYVNGKSVTKGTPCGKIAFRVKSNGDVTPNVFTNEVSGNIFKQKLIDILNHTAFKIYESHSPEGKCINCVNYESCQGGDITDSYLLSGNLYAPDPFCFLKPDEHKQVGFIDINDTKFVHETYLGTIYIPIGD